MDVLEAVKYLMRESGKSASQLSRDIGRSHTYIGTTFGKGSDIGASNAAKIARTMGWRLVFKKGDVEVEITPRD